MTFEDYKATQADAVSEFVEDRHNGLCDGLDGLPLPIASGSNGNGNWLKLANGTLIQWGRTANKSITLSSGYAEDGGSITFPISFDSAPPCVLAKRCYTTGSWLVEPEIKATITASGAPLGYASVGASDATMTVASSWLAIGTWS